MTEEIEEELVAIEAIYGEDYKRLRSAEGCVASFKIDPLSREHGHGIRVDVPCEYPRCVARITIVTREAQCALPRPFRDAFGRAVAAAGAELGCLDRPHLFDLVQAANDWLTEHKGLENKKSFDGEAGASGDDDDDDDDTSEEDDEDDDEDDDDDEAVPMGAANEKKARKRRLYWWEQSDDAADTRLVAWATDVVAAAPCYERGCVAAAAAAGPGVRPSKMLKKRRKGSQQSGTAEWNYVIGLVGKPSSGKSTFFNAARGLLDGLTLRRACPDAKERDGAAEHTTAVAADADKMAKMAAHPFTTLAPNFAHGYAAVQCPCGGDPRCAAPYGHALVDEDGSGRVRALRLVPVVLKDVAGLVPGAYRGRGRGNRFLDDLNDADVLIHIVDVSGETDNEGRSVVRGLSADAAREQQKQQQQEQGQQQDFSPERDVGWIRGELHRWIFDNVKAKWAAVRRRPEKLAGMFSGYHADRALVQDALVHAGVNPVTYELSAPYLAAEVAAAAASGATEGASGAAAATATTTLSGQGEGLRVPLPLAEWRARELHYVVAHFLRTRFPILLALNKADAPAAVYGQHVARVRAAWPHEAAVPVSARGELLLQQLRAAGVATYAQGAATFDVRADAGAAAVMEASYRSGMRDDADETKPVAGLAVVDAALANLRAHVLAAYRSTGVARALWEAMRLRPPVVAFPVADVAAGTTLVPFDDKPARTFRTRHPDTVYGDCVLLRPRATVGDLCDVLCHQPWALLAGDYVRAEARAIPDTPDDNEHEGQQQQQQGTVVVRKDTRMTADTSIICFAMTRKAI